MALGGDVVHYNYPHMQAIATRLHQCGSVAQTLKESGAANKVMLLSGHTGDAAVAFESCHQKYEQVCQDTIDITFKGAQAYDHGTAAMGGNEKNLITAFPG